MAGALPFSPNAQFTIAWGTRLDHTPGGAMRQRPASMGVGRGWRRIGSFASAGSRFWGSALAGGDECCGLDANGSNRISYDALAVSGQSFSAGELPDRRVQARRFRRGARRIDRILADRIRGHRAPVRGREELQRAAGHFSRPPVGGDGAGGARPDLRDRSVCAAGKPARGGPHRDGDLSILHGGARRARGTADGFLPVAHDRRNRDAQDRGNRRRISYRPSSPRTRSATFSGCDFAPRPAARRAFPLRRRRVPARVAPAGG